MYMIVWILKSIAMYGHEPNYIRSKQHTVSFFWTLSFAEKKCMVRLFLVG